MEDVKHELGSLAAGLRADSENGNEKNELMPGFSVPVILVPSEKLKTTALQLAGEYNVLMDLTATDWQDYFEITYFLWVVPEGRQLWLKVRVPRSQPDLPSVSEIWPAALCMEREAYDLMGINFNGHPDLRRILCPDDFEGHPLRKDFVVEPGTREWD